MFNRNFGKLALAAVLFAGIVGSAYTQQSNPGVQQSGAVVANDCVKWGPGVGQIQSAGGVCAAGVTPAALTKLDDTNVTMSLGGSPATALLQTVQITMSWLGQLSIARGGTGQSTRPLAISALMPVPTRAGDVAYWDGTNWVTLAGNNSGTQVFSESAIGIPAWLSNSMTFGGQSVALGASATVQGNGTKIQLSTGVATSGNCVKFDANGNTVDNGAACGGATGANPSATASDTAINGVATTFMRSDGAPAVQKGTNAAFGVVQGDNVTVTCAAGVCGAKATTFSNSLGADVALSNTGTYFDGPSTPQGTTGTFFSSGTVTLVSPSNSQYQCKLWDNTTVIASGSMRQSEVSQPVTMSLSGTIASPTANIRISCKNTSVTTGNIVFNSTGNSKDSTLTTNRIQ